jgi:hypothetical protein
MELIKSLIHSIMRFVVINIALILFSLAAPLLYALPVVAVAVGAKVAASNMIQIEILT